MTTFEFGSIHVATLIYCSCVNVQQSAATEHLAQETSSLTQSKCTQTGDTLLYIISMMETQAGQLPQINYEQLSTLLPEVFW